MLGRNSGQQTFTAVGAWCGDLLDEDSFYGRMNRYGSTWFRDEDYATMYGTDGRPSVPPSLMAKALMLQMYDNVSDRELVARIRFDLRYKYALDMPIEYQGFDPSLLTHFRARLLSHNVEAKAFERSVAMAKGSGLVAAGEDQATDSSPIHGAAAVQDTWTLLRTGIEKLLRALGPFEARGFRPPFPADKYVVNPGKPDIDWNDAGQRNLYLAELVADARALVEAVREQHGAEQNAGAEAICSDPAVRTSRELLQRLVEQDIVDGPEGPRIRKGKDATKNRIISTNDPEMRHGHKSKARLFAGYKNAITITLTEVVTSVDVIAANAPDATPLLGQLDTLKQMGVFPRKLYADCAYASADMRFEVQQKGCEVMAKVPASTRATKFFPKERFTIETEGRQGRQVTCPAGQTTTSFRESKDEHGRTIQVAQFAAEQCTSCPLREQCTPNKASGRSVELHHRESVLQAARRTAAEPGFHADMKKRLAVERVISRLQGYGLKVGRYIGRRKTLLQALLAATVNNFWKVTSFCAVAHSPVAWGSGA